MRFWERMRMVGDEILNAAVGRMRHLGDITKIDGHTAPWVDCIIGGSPCQDLSIAGKRACGQARSKSFRLRSRNGGLESEHLQNLPMVCSI